MAKTILFVHGTGVRKKSLARSVELIRAQAAKFLPYWKIEVCAWGDPFGAALHMDGASVPHYQRSGNATDSLAAKQKARWVLLADDPLIELRVSPGEQTIGPPPGPLIWQRTQALGNNSQVSPLLDTTDLTKAWPAFIADVVADAQWQAVVSALSMTEAAASPMMARAMVAAFQGWLREHELPTLDAHERDAWVQALQPPLGGPPGAVVDWLLGRLSAYGRTKRGSLTDLTSPVIGDILRYQARGDTLRAFIGEEVKRTGANVLLAHSLGGIAAVDWLALESRTIQALVTVGSQAAYFYEIDALYSRPFGSGLPQHFPHRWLNLYDENDFLSYPANSVFKGHVQDEIVDNGEPFPEAHSAYFANRHQVWPHIADFLMGL
jgi:DNA-binding transcriptional regulator YbjK